MSVTDEAQTFTVTGVVTLPAHVSNGLNRNLTASIEVSVNEYREIIITAISDALQMDIGEEVIVRGFVTGFYEPSQGADGSFYLRDGAGADDAIIVRLTTAGNPPTPGARSFLGQYVEVVGTRQHPESGNGFINIANITVADPFLDILIIDAIPEIPLEPTPVELEDLLSAAFRSQLVSLDRVLVGGGTFRTGPAMPLSNWLLLDPVTGETLNIDGFTFAINFAADYENLGFDRPLDTPAEPVWITIPAANVHWWNARNEIQIRFTEPWEQWSEVIVE